MTDHAKLLRYAKSCGNRSYFRCVLKEARPLATRRWEAIIRVWWSPGELRAMGRTRAFACHRLAETVAEYDPTWEEVLT